MLSVSGAKSQLLLNDTVSTTLSSSVLQNKHGLKYANGEDFSVEPTTMFNVL